MPFEVVFHDGPLPKLGDSPLSPAELAFRKLLAAHRVQPPWITSDPSEYARWAEQTRINWTANRVRDSTVLGAESSRRIRTDNTKGETRRRSPKEKR